MKFNLEIKMKLFKVSLVLSVLMLFTGCTQLLIGAMNQVKLTKIAIEHDKMYLLGDFNSQSYAQVTKALRTHPKVKTIVLTANSGSLDDDTTFKLARYIRSKALNTYLLSNSVIASGAVDLFLSGKQRTIEKGAMLGVHSWSDGSKQAKDFPKNHPEHSLNASYIKDMMGTDAFYWFTIYAAPADSIYWLKTNEIKRFNLATKIISPSHSNNPFGNAFIKERRQILED
jgi:beta-lactamase class D